MKQTAVDWLVDQVENYNCMKLCLIPSDIIEKAKQMEKEQIENAWWAGCDEGASTNIIFPSEDCNGYYNETFKTKEK